MLFYSLKSQLNPILLYDVITRPCHRFKHVNNLLLAYYTPMNPSIYIVCFHHNIPTAAFFMTQLPVDYTRYSMFPEKNVKSADRSLLTKFEPSLILREILIIVAKQLLAINPRAFCRPQKAPSGSTTRLIRLVQTVHSLQRCRNVDSKRLSYQVQKTVRQHSRMPVN